MNVARNPDPTICDKCHRPVAVKAGLVVRYPPDGRREDYHADCAPDVRLRDKLQEELGRVNKHLLQAAKLLESYPEPVEGQ